MTLRPPRQPPVRRRPFRISRLRLALMLFALLAVIALTADLVSLRLRAERAVKEDGLTSLVAETLIEVTTATNRWVDSAGRFSIKAPPGWSVAAEQGGTYALTLRGPLRMELSLAVREAPAGGLEAIRGELEAIEQGFHLTTSIQADTFQGRPAWRRTMPLNKSKLESLDFMADALAVHVMVAAPVDAFDDLRVVLVELRNSLAFAGGAP